MKSNITIQPRAFNQQPNKFKIKKNIEQIGKILTNKYESIRLRKKMVF